MAADTTKKYAKRLEAIAATVFGDLTDDTVLELLAERKQLQTLKEADEQARQEEERVLQAQEERTAIEKELARLNALISPDKPDDELIHLIEERKTWEAKLAALGEELMAEAAPPETRKEEAAAVEVVPEPVSEEGVEEATLPNPVVAEVPEAETVPESGVIGHDGILHAAIDKDFGEHKIFETTIDTNSELGRFLEQIRENPETMGKVLDSLSAPAKRDKAFMLAVAEIDPAYAMHYADKDVLKKDEDFNLRVVSTKGKRSSGSVLAEMLPEARTEAVVMAALKQDYRNIRFALPQMGSYDAMLEKAKKAALEKVKELKESVDVALLVPKILQKDKAFMEQVNQVVGESQAK